MKDMDLLWLRVAAVLYAGASIAVFPAAMRASERWRSWCVHLAGLGFFFHFVSAVEMLVKAHRWVPVGEREAESLLGLAVIVLFFLVWWIYGAISFGIFALPAITLLVFVPALGFERYTFPSQGVRMGWLVVHISTLLAAYAALGFSILASGFYLLQERRLKSKPRAGEDSWWIPLEWLPPLDTLERIAHTTLLVGFPCMTVGLLIGSLLAQETSLGAAYFRDPKVIASFIMWAVYCLLLLIRRSAGLRGRKAAYLSGAVFVVMLAVWAANVVSQVHRYGAQ
jgi:ABC-type uncharacterized transport system permease subunit